MYGIGKKRRQELLQPPVALVASFVLGSMLIAQLVMIGITIASNRLSHGNVSNDALTNEPWKAVNGELDAAIGYAGAHHAGPNNVMRQLKTSDQRLEESHQRGRNLGVPPEWKQLGDDLKFDFEWSRSELSKDGKRFFVSRQRLYEAVEQVFYLDETSGISPFWEELGSRFGFHGRFDGSSKSVSADGSRLAAGYAFASSECSRCEDDDRYPRFDDDDGDDDYNCFDACSNFGYVNIHEWNGQWWNVLATFNGTRMNEKLGIDVSLSDNGRRIMIANSRDVKIYDNSGSLWKQIGSIGHSLGFLQGHQEGVSMSGNGETVVVSTRLDTPFPDYWANSMVEVYRQRKSSSWTRRGSKINGTLLSMSADGNRLAIGPPTARSDPKYIRIYDWKASSWRETSSLRILDECGDSVYCSGTEVTLSDDGIHLLLASKVSQNKDVAQKFKLVRSKWIQEGADLVHFDSDKNHEGGIKAYRGKFAIMRSGDDQYVSRIFEFDSSAKTNPFPPKLNKVNCAYTSCLDNLLRKYYPDTTTIDGKNKVAYDKILFSRRIMSNRGQAVHSLFRLMEATKYLVELQMTDPRFTSIGRVASTCSINLLRDFIKRMRGQGVLQESFLDEMETTWLTWAKEKRTDKEFKKAVSRARRGVRAMTKKLKKDALPLCSK